MKPKRTWLRLAAAGLLALLGWKAFSHFGAAPAGPAGKAWVCPMRCLNRIYAKAGECPVCHMRLVPYVAPERHLSGYVCPLHRSEKVFEKPGDCPFCGLKLKEQYEGAAPLLPEYSGRSRWPRLAGKTAVFYRPYEVQVLGIESYVRAAGRLKGRALELRLPPGSVKRLRRGGSAMVSPPEGYARPVLARIVSLGPGERARLSLDRPIAGADWALADISVYAPPAPAVPLSALLENGQGSRVFVMQGESAAPRAVTVLVRGEYYASVEGLNAGETVAGAGVFWLDHEWHLEHP